MKPLQRENIGYYISSFPCEVQDVLEQIRLTIKHAVPTAKESLNIICLLYLW
jgi:hypothetical protein